MFLSEMVKQEKEKKKTWMNILHHKQRKPEGLHHIEVLTVSYTINTRTEKVSFINLIVLYLFLRQTTYKVPNKPFFMQRFSGFIVSEVHLLKPLSVS